MEIDAKYTTNSVEQFDTGHGGHLIALFRIEIEESFNVLMTSPVSDELVDTKRFTSSYIIAVPVAARDYDAHGRIKIDQGSVLNELRAQIVKKYKRPNDVSLALKSVEQLHVDSICLGVDGAEVDEGEDSDG